MNEGYPRTMLELEKRFSSEEASVEYLASLRWPSGWSCPRLQGGRRLDGAARPMALRGLPLRDVGHGWNYFSRQPSFTYDLVPGHVATHQPEERHQRPWPSARVGFGKLQNSLGNVAQVTPSHGSSRRYRIFREHWILVRRLPISTPTSALPWQKGVSFPMPFRISRGP